MVIFDSSVHLHVQGKHQFTKSNTMAPALYPNALYCDCGKCSAVEDTMLEESTGALALVVDKWNVSEPEKGHKLVEYAGRGLGIPDDLTEPPAVGSYLGNYEFMPDGSWTGAGIATETFKGEGTTYYTWRGGLASETPHGKHLQIYRWHWHIRRRQWRRHLRQCRTLTRHLHSRAPSKAADTKTR